MLDPTRGLCAYVSRRNLGVVCSLVLLLGVPFGPADGQGPMREPWSRGSERFVRQWLFLGPLPAGYTGVAATVRPGPETSYSVPGGDTRRWFPSTSYGDAVDLVGTLGLSPHRGEAPEDAYAYATVTRENDGDALISAGVDGSCRIWVNGAAVRERATPRTFAFDDERVPVRLARGENRILVALHHESGPWRLALRVLAPGAVVSRIEEIAPSIVRATPAEVVVRTHVVSEPTAARVSLDVVAAGGRLVSHAEAGRGEDAHLDVRSAGDGAYEIRCTTETAWGRPFVVHLPWYKGDVTAAARRLFDAARVALADAQGATVRMLAEMVRDRLGDSLEGLRGDAWASVHSPLLEFEELEQARQGGVGAIRPFGFVRLAWIDETDGSTQYCRAYLPPDYDRGRRWPLVVSLHGYNPPNPPYVRWWGVDGRHNPMADNHGVIFIEPHARGNAQYRGIGEQDVLRAIAEAKRTLSVDDDRVYLMGESMGGAGTWIIASRHPDLFAAAAPIFGGWDFRLLPGSGVGGNPRADTPPELFAVEALSSFANAENLCNVPLFVNHGDADPTVSVEHSRHVVRMLQRWGFDIRYEEHPGWGHEDLDSRDGIVDWLLMHRRVAAPRRVRLRATDLGSAAAYWVRVRASEDPFQLTAVDAEVVEPGLIRLDTSNVGEIALSPPAALRRKDGSFSLVWNGKPRDASSAAEARYTLSNTEGAAPPLEKRADLEGQISNVLTTPFVIVVGTASSDPSMRDLCKQKADTLAELWKQWQHEPLRMLNDDQVTPNEEKQYSLVLVGGPDANLVSRRLADRLPLRVARDSVTIDGRMIPATDAVVQMIYPSPVSAERYVLEVAATSAAGMYFWNPGAFWNQQYGFPALSWDWNIRDGRRVTLEQGRGPERGWVAAGMFDSHWRRDDRWVFLGDADARSNSSLRHAPSERLRISTGALDACAGRYELAPGYDAVVARDGDRLTIAFPGGAPVALVSEGETEFAMLGTAVPVVFSRDAQGRVTALVLNDDGQVTTVKKVQ